MTRLFGLIGFPLSHSFSKKYFSEKFLREKIENTSYELFPLESIGELSNLLVTQSDLKGLNVTIPYKQAVMPMLSELDVTAQKAGAVNTINITIKEGKPFLKGFNTDVYGFRQSLKPFLESQHDRALILGTGGASKAVAFVLDEIGIPYVFVSRHSKEDGKSLPYDALNADVMKAFKLIVNTTPVGMYPNVDQCPPLPYEHLGSGHFLYDLVYNPVETLFMKEGKKRGALTQNGLDMLHMQAEKAWEIWNNPAE